MPILKGTMTCDKNSLLTPVIDPLAAAPSDPVAGQMYFNTANKKMYYFDGDAWVATSAGGATAYDYILLQHTEPSGTNGGTSGASGSWVQRKVNNIAHDDTGEVVLSSNNFTLPAGSYEAAISYERCEDDNTMSARLRLYNVTDSSPVLYGGTKRIFATSSFGNVGGNGPLTARGKFTLSASKTLRVEMMQTNTNSSSWALGNAYAAVGVAEVYGEIELRKIA